MRTEVPSDLQPLTAEALAELEQSLVAEFDEMHDSGEVDLGVATEIADALDAVRGRQAEVAAEQAEAEAEFESIAARIRPSEGDEGEGDSTDEPTDATADGEGDGEGDGGAGDEPPADDPDATADEGADAGDREPVTAGAPPERRPRRGMTVRPPSARAMSGRAGVDSGAPPADESGRVSIVAASDVPGYASGAQMDVAGIARAFHDRARALSNGSAPAPVCRIEVPYDEDRTLGSDRDRNLEILTAATRPPSAEALVAAGWCAPSDNVYEMFEVESTDGLLDLPSLAVSRGGVNVPDFIGFGAASDALWTWTEDDQDDALDNDGEPDPPDVIKPCLRIPCPDFTDYRLEADGLCLTHGNLTDAAWPELTARFVRLTVVSHLHYMSARRIAKIVADATTVALGAGDSDAAGDLLSAIDLQVADFRNRERLSNTAVLEVGFPHHTRALLRSNLAKRAGVDLTNVTDAMLDAHFAARSIRPQYLHDFLPIASGGSPATAWPTSFEMLMWVAGSYFNGDGAAIDLGVVRDSRLNETNDYTAAWSEQSYLVGRRGPAARRVTLTLAPDGVTACCPLPETD